MKPTRTLIITLAIATAASGVVLAQGYGRGAPGSTCHQALQDRLDVLPPEPLSAAEEAALLSIREEEKLARDVYATLAVKWDIPIFTKISRAEQQHMDMVGLLLERYALTDPVTDDAIGAFNDPAFGDLFGGLVASGEGSLLDALVVGAALEDRDLADLASLIAESDNPDIALVAHNLAKGSRNHLRAFVRMIGVSGGETYVARHLGQDEIDSIITSAPETGVVYDELGQSLATCDGRGGRGARGMRDGSGQGQGSRQGRGRGQGRGLRDGSCGRTAPSAG